MGCGTKTIKISTIVFNVIFGLIGVLLIIGLSLGYGGEEATPTVAVIGCVIGAFVILFAIIGCLAALRESTKLAIFCCVFFLLLGITHIVLVCLERNDRDPNKGLNLVNSAWGNDTRMNDIQLEHHCCGKSSAQDYVSLSLEIPPSCYSSKDPIRVETLYMEGCSAKVQEHYENDEKTVFITQWVIIALEFLGFFLHLYLYINFRNKQRRLQF